MATAINLPIHQVLSSDYTTSCSIHRIPLDLGPIGGGGKIAYLLENVFSPQECSRLIEVTETGGYEPALVHVGQSAIRIPGYRDSHRLMVDDKEFVSVLFQRIGHFLPQSYKTSVLAYNYELLEINERLRFLRYSPGDKFKVHMDGHYEKKGGSARTLITLQMYLNEGFEGGETTFLAVGTEEDQLKPENRIPVVPKTGMVLVFQHNILHEGSLLRSGTKYTIRTDVLYHIPDSEVDKDKKSICTII